MILYKFLVSYEILIICQSVWCKFIYVMCVLQDNIVLKILEKFVFYVWYFESKRFINLLVLSNDISSVVAFTKSANNYIWLRYQINMDGNIITRLEFISNIIHSIILEWKAEKKIELEIVIGQNIQKCSNSRYIKTFWRKG